MKPATFSEIAHWLNVPQETSSDAGFPMIQGVAVDSRCTKAGDLFFALPGAHTDGHAFLAAAAAQGAVAAVVQQDYRGPDHGLHLLRVENSLNALQLMSKNYLQGSKAEIVAVTGSLGKTTCKGFIAALLKRKYRVSCNEGNQNSQIGLPLTILNQITLDEELLVLEMGMTMAGEIRQLTQIAPPTVALVTLVAPVHIVNFASLEGIAAAKAEIFSHPRTQFGFYHKESDLNGIFSKRKLLSFSTASNEADFTAECSSEGLIIKGPAESARSCRSLPFPALIIGTIFWPRLPSRAIMGFPGSRFARRSLCWNCRKGACKWLKNRASAL